MSTLRTAAISSLTAVVLAFAVYFAALPHVVSAARPGAATCALVSATSLSNQQLWDLLNARYEHQTTKR